MYCQDHWPQICILESMIFTNSMKIYALNYQSNHNITAKNPIIEEIYLSATQVWKQAHTICTLWQEIIQSHLGVCIVKPWHIISMNLIRCNALFFSPRFMCFNVYKAVSCITLFSASKMKAEIRVAYERKHAFSIKEKFNLTFNRTRVWSLSF